MSDRALTGLLRGSYTYVLPTSLQPSLLCQAPLRLASIVRALQPSFPVFLLGSSTTPPQLGHSVSIPGAPAESKS